MRTILSHSRLARACAVAGAVADPSCVGLSLSPQWRRSKRIFCWYWGRLGPRLQRFFRQQPGAGPHPALPVRRFKALRPLVGSKVQLNLIDDSTWRAGPMIVLRPKRDSDVDDAIVSRMKEIDSEVAGGVFVQYNLKLSAQKLHQLVFSGDVVGASNGTVARICD